MLFSVNTPPRGNHYFDLSHHEFVLPILELHITRNWQYVPFCVCILSFNIMSVRLFLLLYITVFFSLSLFWSIPLFEYIAYYLSILPWWTFRLYPVWASINKAGINILAHLFYQTLALILLDRCPGVDGCIIGTCRFTFGRYCQTVLQSDLSNLNSYQHCASVNTVYSCPRLIFSVISILAILVKV